MIREELERIIRGLAIPDGDPVIVVLNELGWAERDGMGSAPLKPRVIHDHCEVFHRGLDREDILMIAEASRYRCLGEAEGKEDAGQEPQFWEEFEELLMWLGIQNG